MGGVKPRTNHARAQVAKRFQPGIHFVWIPGFLCESAASGRGFSPSGWCELARDQCAPAARQVYAWVRLGAPDFCKESVTSA